MSDQAAAELADEITETLARRRAEAAERLNRRRADRAEFGKRRAYGLRQRHARKISRQGERTMISETTRRYEIGGNVIIRGHQIGACWDIDRHATVVAVRDDEGFCQNCHCNPVNPDHGDGTLCCPGPWYVVEYRESTGEMRREIYGQDELILPTPEQGDRP